MKLLILALIAFAGWAWFSGYRVHPENVPYYIKVDVGNSKQELTLTDGSAVTGIIEEDAADFIKLNVDGVVTTFKKSQVRTMKSVAAPDFLTLLKKNYDLHHSEHPLLTHRKEDTATAKFDHFAMEPTRLAEEMKKKNPGLSATDELEKAMAAAGRMRLAAYKAQKEAEKAAVES